MVTRSDLKLFSEQIVEHVRKETKKLEEDKKTQTAALKQSEERCARVSNSQMYFFITSPKFYRGTTHTIDLGIVSYLLKLMFTKNYHPL